MELLVNPLPIEGTGVTDGLDSEKRPLRQLLEQQAVLDLPGGWSGRVLNERPLMAVFKFMCPVTGHHVDTGLQLDAQSFASLPRESTELACPHCEQPHILAGVSAWLGELQSVE